MDELGPIYRRPHNRGLEQNCLPLALTNAITPALTPAQITEAINCCVFRPAIEQTIKLKFFSEYHIGRIYIYICTQVRWSTEYNVYDTILKCERCQRQTSNYQSWCHWEILQIFSLSIEHVIRDNSKNLTWISNICKHLETNVIRPTEPDLARIDVFLLGEDLTSLSFPRQFWLI